MDKDSDSLIAGEQRICPECDVLMRGDASGYGCPARGHHEAIPDVKHPGEGSGVLKFRRRR